MRTPTGRGWGRPSYLPRGDFVRGSAHATEPGISTRAAFCFASRSVKFSMMTKLQEILANTPRLEQPPVDPRIPLAGFTFNPASQLFEDSPTATPSTRRRTPTPTPHAPRVHVRHGEPAVPAAGRRAAGRRRVAQGHRLGHQAARLLAGAEAGARERTQAFNSFPQLSSRFTPRKSYELPAAPAPDPPLPVAVPGTPLLDVGAARSAEGTAAAVVAAARSVGSPAARDAALRDAHEQARSRGASRTRSPTRRGRRAR